VDDEHLAFLPHARVVFAAQGDPGANFELTVRALIEGLHARLAQQAIRSRKRS
jgi:hypothetical protein